MKEYGQYLFWVGGKSGTVCKSWIMQTVVQIPCIRIRGFRSLAGFDVTHCMCINGIPVEQASFAALNSKRQRMDRFWKDAQAGAMYVARGAQGVIVSEIKGNSEKRKRSRFRVMIISVRGAVRRVSHPSSRSSAESLQHGNIWTRSPPVKDIVWKDPIVKRDHSVKLLSHSPTQAETQQ